MCKDGGSDTDNKKGYDRVKMDKKLIYMFRYLLLADVFEVGVVEVYKVVLGPSDPSGNL